MLPGRRRMSTILRIQRVWVATRAPTKNYEVIACIASGASNAIYLCRDDYDCEVAVKVLKPEYARSRRRFQAIRRETDILASIRHRNIVAFHEAGLLSTGLPFLCTELLRGPSLRDAALLSSFDTARICQVLIQVLQALECLHKQALLHLDVKPENILIRRPAEDIGAQDEFVLIDFGNAHPSTASTGSELALSCHTPPAATPAYASAELLKRYMRIDTTPLTYAEDLYALGIIAFELATGQLPYRLPAYRRQWLRTVREFSRYAGRGCVTMLPHPLDTYFRNCVLDGCGEGWSSATHAREWLIANAESSSPNAPPCR